MRSPFATVIVIALGCSTHDSADARRPPPASPIPPQAAPSPDSSLPQPPPLTPPGTDILRRLYEHLTGMGEDRAAVRARLGVPEQATAETHPNLHDSTATDTLVLWTYDQLRFHFLVVSGRDFLVEVRASTESVPMAQLTGQVNTLEAAEAALGAPAWTTALADTMVYSYNISEPDIGVSENAIGLYFTHGRLVFVAAVPYVD